MNFNILFDYPFWFILLCLLCGLIYAGILYYRNRRDGFPLWQQWVFGGLRFIAVSIIAFLLLGPLVQRTVDTVEEPLLIFAQDNSQSVLMGPDSTYYTDEYLQDLFGFMDNLSTDFDTRLYTFGEEFKPADSLGFQERLTNISDIFSGIEARYSNRNIGAVVLASDGIYNRGINPVVASAAANYPVYTIAMGDTVPRRDLILSRVNHNRITYLDNIFPVEVHVEALRSQGLTSRLAVSRDGEELFSENLAFETPQQFNTIMVELEADQPGMQRYRAEVSPVDGEVNLENNHQDFYIEVIDGRQKVLILGNAPHPDIGAIKKSLEDNDSYEVESYLFNEFDGNLEAYSLAVLHQLPSNRHNLRGFIPRLLEHDLPALFIIGQQTNLSTFNDLGLGLSIRPRSDEFAEAQAEFNPSFTLFSFSDRKTALLSNLPPLFAPFARYETAAANTMIYQKIGNVVTEQPLIMFSESGLRNTGVITGEGIWRWRLATYQREGDHALFDELVSRKVQFLALREDRSRFRVNTEGFIFENDPAVFEAELYNRSFELVNDPEVELTITSEEQDAPLEYMMGRTSNAYRLNAGTFSPGEYTYEARTNLGTEEFVETGKFNVSPLNVEGLSTIADHNLLFRLSNNTGGEMFAPGNWDELADAIMAREDIKPVLYSRKEFDEIINLRGIFFFLLLLLSAEWFMRKRAGSY